MIPIQYAMRRKLMAQGQGNGALTLTVQSKYNSSQYAPSNVLWYSIDGVLYSFNTTGTITYDLTKRSEIILYSNSPDGALYVYKQSMGGEEVYKNKNFYDTSYQLTNLSAYSQVDIKVQYQVIDGLGTDCYIYVILS